MTELLLRASSVRDCTRKAILEATCEPDRDRTDREERILWRGRSLGADYVKWLKAKYGPNAVWKEVKVPWAYGVGHIDIFLRPTRTAIEVLSSAHASSAMVASKLLQLTLYLEHYPRAHNGCLIVLDPSDFTEERFPLAKNTDTYRGFAAEVHARIRSIERWREAGELPGRVCGKPSDAIGHFCRHADTCFAGWEPPEPAAIIDDPETITLAAALQAAKWDERSARVALADAERIRKEVEGKLVERPGLVAGENRIGSFLVKRTFTQRRPSLDVRKAELAGALQTEALAEFMKPGAAYWTTTIDRADEPVPADFGDEAPF